MIERIKSIALKYKKILLYLIFGVLTTAVDWIISFTLYSLHVNVHLANVTAWVCAVLFAFITNRTLVFESRERTTRGIARELALFSGGRVTTLLLQELIVFVFYDLLTWNPYFVKMAAAVLVVILNYVISKLLVFKKK